MLKLQKKKKTWLRSTRYNHELSTNTNYPERITQRALSWRGERPGSYWQDLRNGIILDHPDTTILTGTFWQKVFGFVCVQTDPLFTFSPVLHRNVIWHWEVFKSQTEVYPNVRVWARFHHFIWTYLNKIVGVRCTSFDGTKTSRSGGNSVFNHDVSGPNGNVTFIWGQTLEMVSKPMYTVIMVKQT